MNDTVKEQVILVKDVSFSYNGEPVLKDINLSVYKDDFLWIVGPNGGGKTTLLKLMVGLLHPQKGEIRLFGKEPKRSLSKIGYMTQHIDLDPKFPVDVLGVVLMGRLGNGGIFGPHNRWDKQAAEWALAEVDLLDLKSRPFASLSGGQRRKLLIARALASEPKILILDEPTANLDMVAEKELYELLKTLNKKLTIVTVSHDPTFVSDFVKRVICVNRFAHEHPTSELNGTFMGDIFDGTRRMVRHDRDIGKDFK
jgi:zinc transport system ATP-binding protein